MASILMAAGLTHLESLQDFSERFPSLSGCLDSCLEKIWVCHKYPDSIPKNEDINSLPCQRYYELLKKVKKKAKAGENFYASLTEFSAVVIFERIYSQFNKELTTYLFTKCYLFYNWGVNAFEPVIDHFVIHSMIQKGQKVPIPVKRKAVRWNFFKEPKNSKNEEVNFPEFKSRERSVDLFEELPQNSSKQAISKYVSFKSVAKAIENAGKFYDISKNCRSSYHEGFGLKKILYDIKQRPGWPRKHILSKNNVDDLIKFIMEIPVITDTVILEKILKEYKNWEELRELMSRFLKSHQKINKNNGYERILKRHLKNVKTPPGRKLHPIPKSSVTSYLLDILRRVLPVEIFGKTSVRKSFFSELIKVINGNRNENFIWFSLLRSVLLHKTEFIWISKIGDNYMQSQVVLKLFKFIVVHYVFIILRDHFYITETGSSGFGLRYYKKSDMESASSIFLKELLKKGQISPLKKKDMDRTTIEGNWLNSGSITEEDLNRRLKRTMNADAEYKQQIAQVRFLPKSDGSDELRIITNIVKKNTRNLQLNSKSKKLEKHFSARLSQRKKNLFFVKLFLEFLVDKMGFGFKPIPSNPKLEVAWKKAAHLKEKHGKLFFVKADISAAFDSVKYSTLTDILRGAFEKEADLGKVQLMKVIEWRRINGKIKKVARFSFSNRAKENAVIIHRSVFLHNRKIHRYLDGKFLEIIKQVVMQQKLQIKGRVFKLMKGLAQGSAGRFSTHLCEIYYSSVDSLYFGDFIDRNDSIFLRGVDDYLLITSDPEKAQQFLTLVQHGFPDYNVTFNNKKLKTNLIEDIQEVLYLGLIFNFADMSVKPNYLKYSQGGFLSTVNLFDPRGSNHFNKEQFLQNRSLHLKCLKLHPIVLCKIHNNLKTLRRTVFEASVMQSLRVLALADYLYPGSKKNDLGVYRTLLISCCKIKNLVASSEVSKDEVDWLFFFAAFSVARKYSGQFKLLLLVIRYRLQMCEKVFATNDADLLFRFLKDDILDVEYWEKLRIIFSELRKLPLKKNR